MVVMVVVEVVEMEVDIDVEVLLLLLWLAAVMLVLEEEPAWLPPSNEHKPPAVTAVTAASGFATVDDVKNDEEGEEDVVVEDMDVEDDVTIGVPMLGCCIRIASDLDDCKRFSQYNVPIGWASEAARLLVIKYLWFVVGDSVWLDVDEEGTVVVVIVLLEPGAVVAVIWNCVMEVVVEAKELLVGLMLEGDVRPAVYENLVMGSL